MLTKQMMIAGFVTLVTMGAGCVSSQTNNANPSAAVVPTNSTSLDSGNDIDTATYALEVNDSYTTETSNGMVRVQNYVGSDDPKYVYPDEAFFVELKDVGPSYTFADLKEDYSQVSEAKLGGRSVSFAAGGVQAGDSWMHEAYFDDQSNTLIIMYNVALPGSDLAKELVAKIEWK